MHVLPDVGNVYTFCPRCGDAYTSDVDVSVSAPTMRLAVIYVKIQQAGGRIFLGSLFPRTFFHDIRA